MVSTTRNVWITFYAARDNDPAGSREIAYPGVAPRHRQATVGSGAFNDPITLASDAKWLPVGTRVYVSELHKYFIMEDECVSAEKEYAASGLHHIDLYLSNSINAKVIDAEDALTKEQAENSMVVINPADGYPVDTAAMYSDPAGKIAHRYPNRVPTLNPASTPAPAPAPNPGDS